MIRYPARYVGQDKAFLNSALRVGLVGDRYAGGMQRRGLEPSVVDFGF